MKLIAKVPEGLKGHNLVVEAKRVLRDIGHAALADS
jgi:hypothetical protein